MSVVEPREGQGGPPDDPPPAPAGPPEPPQVPAAPAGPQENGDAGPGEGAIKKIVRNAASVLAGNALGEVLTTYAIVLAASTLGPAGFGRLSAAQAFMEPFDILASFGLGAIAIKVAAERGGADGVLRGTNLAIRAVTAPLTVCIALGVAWSTGREALIPVLIVLCVNTLITPLSSSASLPFEFHQTMHRRIALPAIASVVRFFTAIAAARYLATPVGFQLSGLSSGLVMLLLGLLVARHYYPARLGFDRQLAVHLLRLAWPAAFLEFITMMYLRGSYIVLHGQGDVVLGEYAAADRFVKPVISIGSVFLASALPTIATLAHEKKFDILLTNYRRAVVRMLVVMTPILAVTWLLSRVLLERYAPRYAGAVWPFRALSVSVIFVFLNNLSSVFIIALGQLRLITVVALINLGVYFGLAWALVPSLGATGAALATTVMEGINTVMQLSIVAVLLHRARNRA
ncbi:MAG: oligosaccharide flippase family protein [Polyangiaceae bacterium]|nr:oligosaccharide flippase family protein [Polyangiaceae bacterium]